MSYYLLFAALVGTAAGHGAVTSPRPRQSVDRLLPPWNGPVPAYPIPFDSPNWCESPDASVSDPRKLSGKNGQACFWFNNGCDIGSATCDGVTGQKIPCCVPKFLFNGTGAVPAWSGEGIIADPKWVRSFNRTAARPTTVTAPDRKPTLCDPRLRTVNIDAECGSPEDFWYFAPWRYPGMAPVTDSCGTAGGVLPGQPNGAAGADYTNTSNAVAGDLGSKLPPFPTGTSWRAGSVVEVGWATKAWHGGGYSYRLCPADSDLSEECFQKTPLDFVGNSSLRWGGEGGDRVSFNTTELGWEVSTGTIPRGSMWRKNPIPRGAHAWSFYGASTAPVCEESAACKDSATTPAPGVCKCSGEWNDAVDIMDHVVIPHSLPAGEYVLGWRWDCEESTQIWTSCSDVTITA